MQQTTNVGLNQWEKDDRIQMEDFNSDNAKIDAALGALNAEHVYVGSYTGNGESLRKITLPFTPKFVMLFGFYAGDSLIFSFVASDKEYTITSYGPGSGDYVRTTTGGFQISSDNWHNCRNKPEYYIAFQ